MIPQEDYERLISDPFTCTVDGVSQAFLFFRNTLLDAMLAVYEAAAVSSSSAWSDMFRKINAFTDRILITLMDTYQAFERGNQR